MAVRPLDGDFRIQGEPEDCTNFEDIEHWCRVYSELIGVFRGIAETASGTHRRDRQLQVRQLEQRSAFWHRRRRELLEESDSGQRMSQL